MSEQRFLRPYALSKALQGISEAPGLPSTLLLWATLRLWPFRCRDEEKQWVENPAKPRFLFIFFILKPPVVVPYFKGQGPPPGCLGKSKALGRLKNQRWRPPSAPPRFSVAAPAAQTEHFPPVSPALGEQPAPQGGGPAPPPRLPRTQRVEDPGASSGHVPGGRAWGAKWRQQVGRGFPQPGLGEARGQRSGGLDLLSQSPPPWPSPSAPLTENVAALPVTCARFLQSL